MQAVLGGAAGIAVVAKLFGRRLKRAVGLRDDKAEEPAAADADRSGAPAEPDE